MSSDRKNIRFGQPAEPAATATIPRPYVQQHSNGNGTGNGSPEPAVASAPAVAAPAHVVIPAAPAPVPQVRLGRGLDVGTANLLSAVQGLDGSVTVKRERNAFLEIPATASANRDLLTKLGVPYVQHRDKLFVLGDMSFDLANMFGTEVRRPMQDGFLSPAERDAIPIMRYILERLLGPPAVQGESVHFCVPAESIDKENDTVYHEGIVGGILRKLGYTPTAINEGHAVIYSELGDHDYTGIGVSCGGGMFNVCVAYKTIPAVTFSVARGGDWIDEHVSKVMGIPRTRATAIKESNVNLLDPRTREEEAVVLYYRNLISYVLRNLKQRFELARDIPQFTEPVEVVVSGGTSMVGGFVEVFAEELLKIDFPLPIAGVRGAEDPLASVARGSLIAAALANDGS